MTISEAKQKVNKDTLQQYIGTKITDYAPTAKGTWRIFYYDAENYFKDGTGTLYIQRDYEENWVDLSQSKYTNYSPSSDVLELMNRMNPLLSPMSRRYKPIN